MKFVMSDVLARAIDTARPVWARIDTLRLQNHYRVLEAFRSNNVSDYHLFGSTGYGYADPAREIMSRVFADVFEAETALVQPQLVSGTHAISASLFGTLRPGEHLLSATGAPYETLQRVIHGPGRRSLKGWGIQYGEVPLAADDTIDTDAVLAALRPNTQMVLIQRSCGYTIRRAIRISDIQHVTAAIKNVRPDICVFVDNCYGEFVEEREPTAVGVDLMAGSLIKNPGGTLAPAGGYIAGKKQLVEAAADEVTAPGLGTDVGPVLGMGRILLQGLYNAPHIVGEALMGATVAAALFAHLGFRVLPGVAEPRSDVVQIIEFGNAELMQRACQAVQAASPVDSMAMPVPGELPGYDVPVIMASGSFVQGSSSELSADGPLRPPYALFMQGGSSKEHIIIALEHMLNTLQLA